MSQFKVDLTAEQQIELAEKNLLAQYDALEDFFMAWQNLDRPLFHLSEDIIKRFNHIAVKGLRPDAGEYRNYAIDIDNSAHTPPPPNEVTQRMHELCDYANQHFDADPYHVAAYVLWYLNWIHPFGDGNGRTARAISYLLLCIRLDLFLTGSDIIPKQIVEDRSQYYLALDAADESFKNGIIDTSQLEQMLQQMLRRQLLPP